MSEQVPSRIFGRRMVRGDSIHSHLPPPPASVPDITPDQAREVLKAEVERRFRVRVNEDPLRLSVIVEDDMRVMFTLYPDGTYTYEGEV